MTTSAQKNPEPTKKFGKRQGPFWGSSSDSIVKTLFGSSALVTIIILTLIIIFLFKEGAGFSGLYHKSIQEYRHDGFEYVDILKEPRNDYTQLVRYLNRIKADWIEDLKTQGLSQAQISDIVLAPQANDFFRGYMDIGADLKTFVKEKIAIAIKLRNQGLGDTNTLPGAPSPGISIEQVTDEKGRYATILSELTIAITQVLDHADAIDFNNATLSRRIETFKNLNAKYIEQIPIHLEKVDLWDPQRPVSILDALGAFLTGRNWITASDQHDWYGLLPLLTGSLLVSCIALVFAIPFGVGSAIYVNQIARPQERNLIKPYIEFISAVPSVVIGFFGVIVFGEALRQLSQTDILQWIPFFPLQERLNAFTAGCLLALMAVPTIFTLAEDAINSIPGNFTEASLAMGASKLQTTFRVIVPSALSGIISATMLGFGRVIGETMVVLLCAGNRIKIPDFTAGFGVFFEPVHTMTGIIAQEMGEVVSGSLHYRALFMVGIVLFFISLLVNFGAQWVVKRYNKIGY